jgi:hypothetical protein
MATEESTINYWALSFHRLAQYCREIADDRFPAVDSALRAEAERLYTSWIESLALPEDDFSYNSRRACALAALRKRTIEIAVRVAGAGN